MQEPIVPLPKAEYEIKQGLSSPSGSFTKNDVESQSYEGHAPTYPLATRLGFSADSFRRAPPMTVLVDPLDPSKGTKEVPSTLRHVMKNRHLQMIAVGGSIGTGLFIGSGRALRIGGPLGVLIAWLVMGFMLFNVVHAMGEMAIMYPIEGGFYTLANRFLDPAWGFAMGWNYVFQWLVVLPLELTAAAITVNYWGLDVNDGIWITVFWVVIIFINVFGALGYAEEEFWASLLKLVVVVMFLFIAVIMNCGGGPAGGDYAEYVGGRYWESPGALANGFKGVCAVFVTAAFSFAGTELVGLAAAESDNPRKNLPSAIKQVFWRITIFYILSLLLIGLLVPYTDERLLGASSYDANASPFVIVIERAGISGLPSLINVTIMVSVLSIGNSCVYGGSRTLCALAQQGFAPSIFGYIDKCGRPLFATILALAFGALAYVNVAAVGSTVFDWLLAVSGLSTLFTWGSICLCHIRFRRAWAVQGHSVDEIPVRAALGVAGSWCGLILVLLVLAANFYIAIFPVSGNPSAENFFLNYLALPIVIVFYVIGFAIFRTRPLRAHEMDLDTGRKCWYTAEQVKLEKNAEKSKPFLVRTYNKVC